MFEIGRVCMKIAGRDAGRYCVVVENLDQNFVLIDGQTRRRKCNISHLEPTEKVLKIKDKAEHDEIVKALEKEGIKTKEKKVVRKAKTEKKEIKKETKSKEPKKENKKAK